MLYTPSLIPKGCYFQDIEIRRTMVKCSTEEALHRAKSLANLEFSWLFVINTIFVVTLYLILDRVYGGNVQCSSLTTSYQSEQYDEERQHFEPHSTQKMCSVQMGKLVDHGDKMWEIFLMMINIAYVMWYKNVYFTENYKVNDK